MVSAVSFGDRLHGDTLAGKARAILGGTNTSHFVRFIIFISVGVN